MTGVVMEHWPPGGASRNVLDSSQLVKNPSAMQETPV